MNKTMLAVSLLFFGISSLTRLNAQTTVLEFIGFEELKSEISNEEVWNGSNGKTQYEAPNSVKLAMDIGWDTAFGGYWKNMWAFSRKSYNTLEPSDYGKHLYASKPGKGAEENGEIYAIGSQNTYLLNPDPNQQQIVGFYISNTTFAYNSMALGDNFAKKFIAEDKDSFVLDIRSYLNQTLVGETQVVLADFRSEDNTKNFILDSWQWVPMTNQMVDSIHFTLSSSDVGDFGINTPLYFALDNIEITLLNGLEKSKKQELSIFPNPATDQINFANSANIESVTICDYHGALMDAPPALFPIDISRYPSGFYFVSAIMKDGTIATGKILKQN